MVEHALLHDCILYFGPSTLEQDGEPHTAPTQCLYGTPQKADAFAQLTRIKCHASIVPLILVCPSLTSGQPLQVANATSVSGCNANQ